MPKRKKTKPSTEKPSESQGAFLANAGIAMPKTKDETIAEEPKNPSDERLYRIREDRFLFRKLGPGPYTFRELRKLGYNPFSLTARRLAFLIRE